MSYTVVTGWVGSMRRTIGRASEHVPKITQAADLANMEHGVNRKSENIKGPFGPLKISNEEAAEKLTTQNCAVKISITEAAQQNSGGPNGPPKISNEEAAEKLTGPNGPVKISNEEAAELGAWQKGGKPTMINTVEHSGGAVQKARTADTLGKGITGACVGLCGLSVADTGG